MAQASCSSLRRFERCNACSTAAVVKQIRSSQLSRMHEAIGATQRRTHSVVGCFEHDA